jgi:hypothetical protein
MTNWERLLFRKKSEFWIRLAVATRYLQPGEGASFLDRAIYRRLSRMGEMLFFKFAQQEIATERMKMAQEGCKHDKAGVDATFCPDCGAQLGADPESSAQVERIVRKVLSEYDVKPKAAPKGKVSNEKETRTLADKLGLTKKSDKP